MEARIPVRPQGRALPDLKTILDREAQEGWRLVQIRTPDLLMSAKAAEKMVAIFERPIVADAPPARRLRRPQHPLALDEPDHLIQPGLVLRFVIT
jgi:hypothetical protein